MICSTLCFTFGRENIKINRYTRTYTNVDIRRKCFFETLDVHVAARKRPDRCNLIILNFRQKERNGDERKRK